MTDRFMGTVKWFNNKKGYGFIKQSHEQVNDEDVFVHYRQIKVEGFRTLHEGQAVEYGVNRGPKGLQASEVKILEQMHAEES